MTTASAPKTESSPAVDEQIIERAGGAYLGLAIADALGATVEFMTPREIEARYGTHDRIIGGGWLRLHAGQVTDDTTMSLALGASILEQGRVEAASVAEAFSRWMRDKPVDIGHTVRRGIVHYRTTGETSVAYDDHGAGNGACMRALPVALATLGAPAGVIQDAATAQAHVTHNNALSDEATLCVIGLVQAALRGACKLEIETLIEDFVRRCPEFHFHRRRIDNPGGYIVETLRAVFQAFARNGDFESAVVDVVNRGGDADTTGAILGMICGAVYGPSAIPVRWLDRLNSHIRERCRGQAEALVRLSPACR
jgi:ADP-ribosyl-[dinitrogen reductase] hydrolase